MKTLADALAAGEPVKIETRTLVGVTTHRCTAERCRTWRPAFALRDVRESPAFGSASFVCDECEGRVRRFLTPLIEAIAPPGEIDAAHE